MRTVRVLPIGAAPAPSTTEPAPAATAAPEAPVKTREMASEGLHQALAAYQAAWPDRRVDPAIAEAVERQNRAMRQLSAKAFPEPETVPDDQPTPIEAARAQCRREADATHALALHRARVERAQQSGAAAAVPQPAPLRSTA